MQPSEVLEAANREFFQKLLANKEGDLSSGVMLDRAVGNYYDLMLGAARTVSEVTPAKKVKFRGSDLPFCGFKYLLESMRQEPRLEVETFASQFFTRSGDAFHANMQKWLGAVGLAYGKWKCPHCKKTYPESKDSAAGVLGPVKCCGVYAEYVEFEFLHSSGFSGHMDTILFLHNKYAVTELKQMGDAIYSSRLKSGPDNHHQHQVQAYRAVAPEQLKIPESKFHNQVLLWYWPRGNIKTNKRWVLGYDPSFFQSDVDEHAATLAAIRKRRYGDICLRCRTERDAPFCPYNNLICFNKDAKYRQRLLELILPKDVTECLATTK